MNNKEARSGAYTKLAQRTKHELIELVLKQRKAFKEKLAKKEKEIAELKEELEALYLEKAKQQEKSRNSKTNQPTSKKAEWDKDGNPTQSDKKKNKETKNGTGKKKKRAKRAGCGNCSKSTMEPDHIHLEPLENCPECGTSLKDKVGRENTGRIIEDIDPPAEKTTIYKEITESKWCPSCKKMVSSKSEKALPGSDIGLNATIEMAYLWIMCSLSLPNIQSFVSAFKSCRISTAGIVNIMIRLSDILQPVYEEIRQDVKHGTTLWADETGWRVNGKLWWLWVFTNKRSAYYWADQSRGNAVVERILGQIFVGIIIVDGWHAYHKIACAKQTCMAHIFRKIRAFIDDYPEYRSIMTFYLRLRKIIRDGQKLQEKRQDLGELVFQRRLKKLKQRLHELLAWKNPNFALEDIIKKVRRQEAKILTFVEHAEAEHHNNFAEYIIKKGVLKRKISGGSKSEKGFKAYACLQSIVMTCDLRGIPFHHFMKESLVQYIRSGKPMLLAEYEIRFGMETARAA